ncbi:AAA ATPase domain-containing protein [Pedococcus dokdonensis]|uniref:AAA ATPase domain-containing protein n=1 Tax=Pedococcus dokdonensis TaxID=443156 RepID=A0A1H0PGC8_9MICO|nr:AAA family ATPase [Pedococcus dokdonensis]SDP03739.1 AAA ATPase domain-containing protein [Pedococcus dokdonensis]
MRVSRVEFEGFRRLARTGTNVDGSLTAFVGFNEAGKTSLLKALAWFTNGGELDPVDFNRSRPPSDEQTPVVKVFFELDESDLATLASIPMDNAPKTLVLHKKFDGNRIRSLRPSPTRPAKPFRDASDRLARAVERLARQFDEAADDEGDDPSQWAATVADALTRPDAEWSTEDGDALVQLTDWLETIPPGRKTPRDSKLAAVLEEVRGLVTEDHPTESVWMALARREPDFVLFQEADRLLETSYEIGPDHRAAIHPAVLRLLTLAGIDPDEMWNYVQSSDSTRRETLLERGNDRLREIFDQAWNQSKVTVRFNVNGSRLEVLIKELSGDGDVTNISERSDGLKTFVALVAFLESGDYAVPPVLLIDEAETHLHYDAQADLVSVLLKSVDTTQVFYTTHSPGCLPSDLGTGIRVIAREAGHADASVIKNNFWEGEGPGFSPLLFAMGAGAAAFSVCRNAVLAEGAADMVLLPTLIRQATGESDLDYQVAPGLANAHGSGIRVEEVAARVVYLTDGDAGGTHHESALKEVGVDARRIFRLPNGHASEDLIHRDDYISVVNDFLEKMGHVKRFAVADVPPETPISKAFADWAKRNKLQIPSKVEIAYALLARPGRRLAVDGRKALISLHKKFVAAFDA